MTAMAIASSSNMGSIGNNILAFDIILDQICDNSPAPEDNDTINQIKYPVSRRMA